MRAPLCEQEITTAQRDAAILAMCVVKKLGYASRPWRIVHVPDGRQLSGPQSLMNADRRIVRFHGAMAFDRKRDAVARLTELRAENAAALAAEAHP